MTPTLSLGLRNFSPSPDEPVSASALLARARAAEEAGVDRLLVGEHVVMGPNIAAYDGTAPFPTGPSGAWLDPLVVLAVVAGATSRVLLATNILIAALRRPVVLAKTVATLAALSGGRFELGVGVGWQREEYAAAGLPFERRGDLLDDALELCTSLWSGPTACDLGRRGTAEIRCEPRPERPVPIWVAGRLTERTLARIVRFGAGWIPWAQDETTLAAAVRRAREELERQGRDPAALLVRMPLPVRHDGDRVDAASTVAAVPSLLGAGVTDFTLGHPVLPPEPAMGDLLGSLVDAFRARAGR